MYRAKILSLIFFLISINVAFAVNLKRIIRAIEKQEFARAIEWLDEEINEEPYNPGAYLLYAQLVAADTLPFYDMEKARRYITTAIEQHDTASLEIKEDLKRAGIYSITFDNTYDEIKEHTFELIQKENTQQAYERFLDLYPDSQEAYIAVAKRDSIAYERTLEKDTWQAYKQYFSKYPNSRFAPIAEVRYHRHLYQEKTGSNSVEDIERFIKEYPESPHRQHAISRLFSRKLTTLAWEPYSEFIKEYPNAAVTGQAIDILYHHDKKKVLTSNLLYGWDRGDSLVNIHQLEEPLLLAISDRGKIGIMTTDGEEFINPGYASILNDKSFCETFSDDVFGFVSDNESVLTNRAGEVFYTGIFETVRQESGIVWIDEDNGKLLHKSGNTLIENVEDFKLLGGHWILITRGGARALLSFTGELLSDFVFADAFQYGSFFVFENRTGGLALYNHQRLTDELTQGLLQPRYQYEEFEFVSDSSLIGFSGEQECLIDAGLEKIIDWGNHIIYPNRGLYYTKEEESYFLHDQRYSEILGGREFQDLRASEKWLAVKKDFWKVIDIERNELFYKQYDSVKLVDDRIIFLKNSDNSYLYFDDGASVRLEPGDNVQQLEGSTDGAVIIVSGSEKRIYDTTGTLLFTTTSKEVQALGDTLFKIVEKGKFGVISMSGDVLLEPKYNLIQKKGNQLYTLKDGKIGNYDLEYRVRFDPEYEAAFDRFDSLYRTRKEGKVGLLNTKKEVVLPFEYQQLEVLEDSLAWAKTDSTWVLISLKEKLVLIDEIKKVSKFGKTGEYYQILSSQGFGLMSSDGSYIFKPVYSDIRKLSNGDSEIFRAEKYFKEAGYYILVWYRSDGEKIYSNAYRPEEYEALYCE